MFEAIIITAILVLSLRRCAFFLASFLPSRRTPYPDSYPGITVLVPARNETATAGQLTRALSRLNYPPDKLSIIFICDGCTDATPALFRSWAATRQGVNVVELTQHAGKAAALNKGFQLANTELIAVVDADLAPRPDFLSEIVKPFADKKVGAVAAYICPSNADENMVTRYASIASWVHQLVTSAGLDRLGLNPPTLGAAAFRGTALEQIGGFSVVPLGEDVATSTSLTHLGWQTRFAADAVADNTVVSKLSTFWHQHVRWARATLGIPKSGKLGSRALWLQRIEIGLSSIGYADRLVFAVAVAGAVTGAPSAWIPLVYLAFPGLEIMVALLKAGVRYRLPWFLLAVSLFFLIDLAGAVAAVVAQLLRMPHRWSNPRDLSASRDSTQ